MSEELRFSVPGDEPGLKELWKSVYNDDTRMDGFFEAVYTPGMAALCLRDGEIVSAAYVLRVGDLVADGRWTPCRAVYALGTRPDCRRQGLAGRVLGLATQALGSAGVIVPGSGDLIPFCRKYGFEPAFSAAVQDCTDLGIPLNGSVTRVTVRGYAALREELLHQTPHIDFDLKLLSCQEEILRRENGGFYYVVAEGQRPSSRSSSPPPPAATTPPLWWRGPCAPAHSPTAPPQGRGRSWRPARCSPDSSPGAPPRPGTGCALTETVEKALRGFQTRGNVMLDLSFLTSC